MFCRLPRSSICQNSTKRFFWDWGPTWGRITVSVVDNILLFIYKLNSESPASIHTLSSISSLQVWWCKAHPKKFGLLCELAITCRQIRLEHKNLMAGRRCLIIHRLNLKVHVNLKNGHLKAIKVALRLSRCLVHASRFKVSFYFWSLTTTKQSFRRLWFMWDTSVPP